jgi:uncharacterized protein
MGEPSHTNRLIEATSPYLLQHAHNPVDWYPWGPEALERAKQENKPILLSIGYAACHWCHVMERESFENERTAELMNDSFVSIKVDREERPDIDDVYMQATIAMSGSGGWPMTVFLVPDTLEPFFAGTYFPPRDMYGRPGFPTLLRRIADLWKSDRPTLKLQAKELADELRKRNEPLRAGAVGEGAIDGATAQLARSFDPRFGGFGAAPKFPPATALELLLRRHRRTRDEATLRMVRRTLDGMAHGGIRDHLGGGFHRYSTDAEWLAPHFEKMLYDNALLARVYAWSWQVTKHPDDETVARETLDYVLGEMTAPEGSFHSATDADSEGVEGKFFVWTPGEIEAVLPAADARAFMAFYDVTPEGNWEHKSILRTLRSRADVASELGTSTDELDRTLAAAKAKLYAARKERVPPLTDDKVLTAWNGLMIGAMAEVGRILDEPRYRDAGARAAEHLYAALRRPDGGFYRTWRQGKAHTDAYLEDYAYLADALVDLYEAGAGIVWLERAVELAERMLADFHDPEHGGFFATAHGHEELLLRMREGQDGAIPSPNAIAARALVRLGWHLGRQEWLGVAERAIRAHAKLIEQAPRAFCASLAVVDMLLEGPVEAVLTGSSAPLARELGRHFLPNRIVVSLGPGARTLAPDGLVAGKTADTTALYVCRQFTCKRPVTDPADVAAVLADESSAAAEGRSRRLGKRIAGAATLEGTGRYAARHAALGDAFGALGTTGLSTSRMGFGGYRIDDGSPAFAEALRHALRSGINLIDTSTNYTDGGSERLVGALLSEVIAEHAVQRDEIVVVSKIGYVQGQNLELAREREEQGRPFPEMVKYAEQCWHCIHPEWLADQLDRSLDRLGLDTLDVCLLHNPEYFLSDVAERGEVTVAVRDAFYERVARAFAWLESQRQAGRIGWYGVSSNTVAKDPAKEPEATELARFLAAGTPGFRVLQLPLNLIENEAATAARVGGDTVLAHAAKAGLGVLGNRPLNAIVDGGMLRLAEVPPIEAPAVGFTAELAHVRELEQRFRTELGADLGGHADELLRWGEELTSVDGRLANLEQWEQLAHAGVVPQVSRAFAAIERSLPAQARGRWTAFRAEYLRALEQALQALRAQTTESARKRIAGVRERIDPLVPLARANEPIQRKALWVLRSTPGLSVALVGMRRKAYVDDALAVLGWSALGKWREAYDVATR